MIVDSENLKTLKIPLSVQNDIRYIASILGDDEHIPSINLNPFSEVISIVGHAPELNIIKRRIEKSVSPMDVLTFILSDKQVVDQLPHIWHYRLGDLGRVHLMNEYAKKLDEFYLETNNPEKMEQLKREVTQMIQSLGLPSDQGEKLLKLIEEKNTERFITYLLLSSQASEVFNLFKNRSVSIKFF